MLSIITIILGLVPVVLKGIPGISATIQQIIADVTASVAALLGSGALTQPNANTILAAWAGVIAALKNDPNLPASSLSAVAELEKIVQSVMLQDSKLAQSVDWSTFHQITPVA
jgi:hypothetical protein